MALNGMLWIMEPMNGSTLGADPSQFHRWQIMIVDDHPIVRMGLAALIDAEPDMRVVAQAEDVQGALDLLDQHTLDLLIIDLSLRESSGLDLLKEVAKRQMRAIVVSPLWCRCRTHRPGQSAHWPPVRAVMCTRAKRAGILFKPFAKCAKDDCMSVTPYRKPCWSVDSAVVAMMTRSIHRKSSD